MLLGPSFLPPRKTSTNFARVTATATKCTNTYTTHKKGILKTNTRDEEIAVGLSILKETIARMCEKTNLLIAALVLDANAPDRRQRFVGDDILGAKLQKITPDDEGDVLLLHLERRGIQITKQ